MSEQDLCQSIKSKSSNTIAEELERKIISITEQQRGYIKSIFFKMAQSNPTNAAILHDYVVAQQNELNMKRIVWLSEFLAHKTFYEITKYDILSYFNSKVRKPEPADPTHKWIGTYNGTQMVFSTFFKWLYNQDEPDIRKRLTPLCMRA
jgi:hypothetical protein